MCSTTVGTWHSRRMTGIKVSTAPGMSQGNNRTVILAQLRRGVRADVVILGREGLDDIIGDHRIVAGTDVNLAQTPLGVDETLSSLRHRERDGEEEHNARRGRGREGQR
jgi:molybdate transport system substrate-binding protein